MMTRSDVIMAVSPFLTTFGAKLTDDQWDQYGLALEHVSPGDLDDALADLRRSHAFRNAPLPAEILDRCDVHRKRRQVLQEQPVEKLIKADPSEGVWKTFELGGRTLRMHVLPDEHPALKRYACLRCKDTGWEDRLDLNHGAQATYQRCDCILRNPVLQRTRAKNAEHARKQAKV